MRVFSMTPCAVSHGGVPREIQLPIVGGQHSRNADLLPSVSKNASISPLFSHVHAPRLMDVRPDDSAPPGLDCLSAPPTLPWREAGAVLQPSCDRIAGARRNDRAPSGNRPRSRQGGIVRGAVMR